MKRNIPITLLDLLEYWLNDHGSEPPVSGKAGRNPQDITPCRIRTQCTMSFSLTGKGVLKAKFQDWQT